MAVNTRFAHICACLALISLIGIGILHPANAQTAVVVYQAQHPVSLDGTVQPGEWSDTPILTDSTSGLTYAFKQNGTGLLFLMEWSESIACPSCFAGIELGHANNTAVMGTPSTPTMMILASPSFKGNVDDFVSTGEFTPTPVEQEGYQTQTICGLTYVAKVYIAECYRPFKLVDASPYDFNFTLGSTAELGFAIGVFTQPGDHLASDMSSYVLSISDQTYTSPSTTASSQSGSTQGTGTSSSTYTATGPSSTSSSAITSSSAAQPSAGTYAEELAVIVVGFSALMVVALTKYRSR